MRFKDNFSKVLTFIFLCLYGNLLSIEGEDESSVSEKYTSGTFSYLNGMSYASWSHDEMPESIAWKVENHPSSLGVSSVEIATDNPHSGAGSLKIHADLNRMSGSNMSGGFYIDTRYHRPVSCIPPECPAVPPDLAGKHITGWIYCPPGLIAGSEEPKNYVQIFLKSVNNDNGIETWSSYYSPAYQITESQPEYPWIMMSADLSDRNAGTWDENFDPSRVVMCGVQIGLVSNSISSYRGSLWLDDFTWDGDGCQPKFGFEETKSSLESLADTKINSVSLVTTWYQDSLESNTIYMDTQKTIPDDRLTSTIRRLHDLGFRVLLKPHMDVQTGDWRGHISPSDIDAWFHSYENMITHYADMAEAEGVEMLCIGNELKSLTKQENYERWEGIVSEVRSRYDGLLTCGSNWNRESAADPVCFWNLLDFAGISAYYPLSNERDPSLGEIRNGWISYIFSSGGSDDKISSETYNWAAGIEEWQKSHGLPVLFTEIGCCSTDYGAREPWFFCDPNQGCELAPNEELQRRYYMAAEQVFSDKPWFKGMFWWTWKPVADCGGSCDKDFTPQNKSLEEYLLSEKSFNSFWLY